MAETESIKMQGNFNESTPNPGYGEEGLFSYPQDPLQLEINDEDLARILQDYEDDYDSFYETKYNLFDRRKKNETYYFGRQTISKEEGKLLKNWESRYQDNVLYEIGGTIKPLLMTRLPDLMATPGNDSEEAVLLAQEISKALDTEIKEEENRTVLGLAGKHLPVYFTGVIKCWWNNEYDDYEFGVVHPDLVKVDWTCPTHNSDDMRFVIQKVPMTVQQIILKFPEKKEEFYEELEKQGIKPQGEETWALLATLIKISECWFDEYIKKGDDKVEKVSGVVWKYENCILKKMKNPNFDYEGETRYFAFDDLKDANTKRSINESELSQVLFTGNLPQNVKEEKVYHNYFRYPCKPFYFMGYDQWGRQPYDETSWIEQNIQNQKSLDERGKQIEETLASRGHHVVSKQAVTPAELEEIDWDDPSLDLAVNGKPSEVHAFISPERPSAQEFQELDKIRERMYAVSHSTATRGDIKANTAATNNQIAREGDFTAADDVVADTITPAAQWMAEWAMHFIKLRYTENHFRWIMGVAGDAVYLKLNRNMILEGMLVKVKASGTDKLRSQNNAMELAKMEMIDPYQMYVDMGLSDPEGRTEKLIMAKTDPLGYLQKVVKGIDTSSELAQQLLNAPIGDDNPMPANNPVMGGGPTTQSAPQGQVAQPTPTNTANTPQTPMGPPPASPRGL